MVWILNQASQSGSSSQVEMAKCTWNRQLVDASMKRSRPSLPASSSAATVPFQRPCTLQDQNPSGAWGDPQISSELAPSSGPFKVFDDYITMIHHDSPWFTRGRWFSPAVGRPPHGCIAGSSHSPWEGARPRAQQSPWWIISEAFECSLP